MSLGGLAEAEETYESVLEQTGDRSTRGSKFRIANDQSLLRRVLDGYGSDDLILDFGCGSSCLAQYLASEGYTVVGIDVEGVPWTGLVDRWQDVVASIDDPATLVNYDGHHIPLTDGSVDLVLMWGTLEHVGIKDESDRSSGIRGEWSQSVYDHRRELLDQIHNILATDGELFVTKFPNRYGRDKFHGGSHPPNARARPDQFYDLFEPDFEISKIFMNGFLPHDLPNMGIPDKGVRAYTRLDDVLSNLPVFREVAQNYNLIAHPK